MMPSERLVSRRADAIAATEPVRQLFGFLETIEYFRRRGEPDLLDFTFGDPHEMPSQAYVSALREAAIPQNEGWFAYQMHLPSAQEAAAAGLRRVTGLPFAPEDMLLTTGAFAALSVGMKLVADPGDGVIFISHPGFSTRGWPWRRGWSRSRCASTPRRSTSTSRRSPPPSRRARGW